MQSKILFISEALSAPFDEGIKNMTFYLHGQLSSKMNAISVTNEGNVINDLSVKKIRLNKLFLNYELWELIHTYAPDVILYLPEASVTFHSFLRAKILKLMNRYSKVVMLGVQKREYSILKEIILKKFLRPDLLLILGKSTKQFFIERGMQALLLPPAVDQGKFFAVSEEEKIKIRLEYNIPADKTVVLHVGHIKVGRNIENLIEVQKTNNMQVVIVGSTSIVIEHRIKEKLIKEGIRIIDQVVHDISKIYKMSDMYVFPVLNNKEAIDMPLSVLEAMSCNLPVITTRYGGLVDYFEEDGCLKYFSGNDELVALVKSMEHSKSNNAKKMEQFTWSSFTDAVISACENII